MQRRIAIVSLFLLLTSLLASCAAAGPPQTSGPIEELTLEVNQSTIIQNPPTNEPDETGPEADTKLNPTPPVNKMPPDASVAKVPGINVTELETQIHSLINTERTKQGLPPLAWNDRLSMIARKHSEDMVQRNYFDHTSPEGYGPMERCEQAGLTIRGCAENIFLCPQARVNWYVNSVYSHSDYHSQDNIASLVVQGWMDSPGHRNNILNGFWTSQGIGAGISADNKVYVTEDFN